MCNLSLFCLFYIISSFIGIGNVEGSYKLKLVSIHKCKLPESKMDRTVDLNFNMTARKVSRETSLIQSNVTIDKTAGPVAVTFRCYQQQQNSGKDLVFQIEKLSCKSPLTRQVMGIIGIALDNSCYLHPGTYKTPSINIQDFSWLLTRAMITTGRYAYDMEFVTPNGILACIDLSCDISEIK